MYNLSKITELINYHNYLVNEYNLPNGEIQIQLDDGYTGEIYAIDWNYEKGTVVLEIDDNYDFHFAFKDDISEGHGKILNKIDEHNLTVSINRIKK